MNGIEMKRLLWAYVIKIDVETEPQQHLAPMADNIFGGR